MSYLTILYIYIYTKLFKSLPPFLRRSVTNIQKFTFMKLVRKISSKFKICLYGTTQHYFFLLATFVTCRVDYGHEEVKVKFGADPRKFSTLTKEFLDDGMYFFFIEWMA